MERGKAEDVGELTSKHVVKRVLAVWAVWLNSPYVLPSQNSPLKSARAQLPRKLFLGVHISILWSFQTQRSQ